MNIFSALSNNYIIYRLFLKLKAYIIISIGDIMDKKIIGKRLRQQREDLELTRENFSEIVGISAPFLAEIESGRKGMSAETLYKICKNLPISANQILLGKDNFNVSGNKIINLIEQIPTKYHEIIFEFLKLFNETINL